MDKHLIIDNMQRIIPNLKHCRLLNISVVDADVGQLTLKLPYCDEIIGNTESRVIHGGALTTLMDTACGFAAITALKEPGICPTLDLRIDYMCPAEPGLDVFGKAEAYRVTNNVVVARGIAYHKDCQQQPIAHCTASFMRIDANSDDKQPMANLGQKSQLADNIEGK